MLKSTFFERFLAFQLKSDKVFAGSLMGSAMRTQYLLDNEDRIVSVGGEWNEFAVENNAEQAMSNSVVGKPVWDFIAGTPTIDFLQEIFDVCRSQRDPLTMYYRCDSPTVKRLFKFSALSDKSNNIVIGNTLIPIDFQFWGPKIVTPLDELRPGETASCASCRALRMKDGWVDIFPAEDYNAGTHVNYTICARCAKAA